MNRLFMARALDLARAAGLYSAHPNPRVGCVLVNDGTVVGTGGHRRVGEAHAEAMALAQAGDRADGADCYVTLEPCAHDGHTPPCDQALIRAGVRRVFVAMADPDPRVRGQGIDHMRQAGMTVSVGLLEEQARRLNPGYIRRQTEGMPWLRCKLAMSLDGRTALANGDSRWITSAAARADGHRWRAMSSAVMTGIGTVLADNPLLTARNEDCPRHGREPVRVILDRQLRFPSKPRLLESDGPVLVCCLPQALDKKNDPSQPPALRVIPIEVDDDDDQAFVRAVMHYLADHEQINEILLEAGPVLSGAFFRAGLIDELILYMAPCFLGAAARPLLDMPSPGRVADSAGWVWKDTRFIGVDLRLIGVPGNPAVQNGAA